jgi:hypothetical protein
MSVFLGSSLPFKSGAGGGWLDIYIILRYLGGLRWCISSWKSREHGYGVEKYNISNVFPMQVEHPSELNTKRHNTTSSYILQQRY